MQCFVEETFSSINYQFETFHEVPQDLEWMDASVIQGIESFRCDAQKKD